MFDVGWSEMFVIGAVAVLVVGPDDLPKVMYQLGRLARRLHYVRFALSQQFDDFMKAHDLDDIRKSVNFEEKTFDEKAADEEDNFDSQDNTKKETKSPLPLGEG